MERFVHGGEHFISSHADLTPFKLKISGCFTLGREGLLTTPRPPPPLRFT